METVNIFAKQVSYYRSMKQTEQGVTVSILKLLRSEKHKSAIEELRKTQNEAIKDNLPCYTPSGIFSKRNDKHLIEHSGFVCIDIDKQHNVNVGNFNELKTLIIQIPYVAYCGLSCRGQGYFVLIPIKYPEKHREHYAAICDDFERCNITIDRTCVNLSRIRFVSYDDQAYFNEQAVVYTRIGQIDSEKQCKNEFVPNKVSNSYLKDTKAKVEAVIREISKRQIDITGDYKQWIEIGAALANEFGERGRSYFHEVSRHCNSYHQPNADRQYTHCMEKMSSIHIGTFFHYAKQYGINI